MSNVATFAPNGAPLPASRQFENALSLAFSRLEPRQRLELEPPIAAAFARRAEALRAALKPPIAGKAFADGYGLTPWRDGPEGAADVAAELFAHLPAFALAAALEDFATGAAGEFGQAPHVSEIVSRAHDHAAPFRAELRRLDSVLTAARLAAPKPRPPVAERQRQADALRLAFGLKRREEGGAERAA